MKISLLQFFSLPIDKSYKNVIMHKYETTSKKAFDANFSLLLGSKYNKILISTPNAHGINRTQNKIEFTLKYDYNILRNYNYVIIQDDNYDYYYYFIDSVEEINSDGAIHISCTWDAWANNLYYLNMQDYDVLTERRTTKDFEDYNETKLQVYNQKLCTNDGDISTTLKNYSLIDEDYEILWLRLTLDTEFEVSYLLGEEGDTEGNQGIPDFENVPSGSFMYLYRPLARFKKGLLYGFDSNNDNFILMGVNREFEIESPNELNEITFDFSSINTTYVLKADLTFNAPFKCNYYSNYTEIECYDSGYPKYYDFSAGFTKKMANGIFAYSEQLYTDYFENVSSANLDLIETLSLATGKDIIVSNKGSFDTYIRGANDFIKSDIPAINQKLTNEQIFKYWVNRLMFPYLKVRVNSKNYLNDVTPPHANFLFTISKRKTGEGFILSHNVYDYNRVEITSNKETIQMIQSNNTLPLTKSAYEIYTEYNASSIGIKEGLAALGSIISAIAFIAGAGKVSGAIEAYNLSAAGEAAITGAYVSQGIGSTVSAGRDYFYSDAQKRDARQQASKLSNSNFNSAIDLYVSDRVFINVEIPNENDDETLAIAKTVRKFGNCINCYHPLLSRIKEKFEYIKTVDCNVSWIPNNEDRAIINQIFNSGVHLWYSDNLQNDEQMNFYYYINLDYDIERS